MPTLNHNCTDYPSDSKEFAPIPEGKYKATIIDSAITAPNKNGTEQLKFTWKITEGPYTDRQIIGFITWKCPTSSQAQEIGRKQLTDIANAVGIQFVKESEQLHCRTHIISVGNTKPNAEGKVYNEVKRCYPPGDAASTPVAAQTETPQTPVTPPVAGVQAAPQAAAPVNNTVRPPWEN